MSKRMAKRPVSRGEKEANVRRAVRDVFDELAVTYANGSAKFAESVTSSLSTIVDSFDDYFTRNLIDDRPEVATAFLDSRLASARETQKLVAQKIRSLQGLRAKAAKRAAKSQRATH